MCLLFYCRDMHPDYPFILLANRDEYYERPARAAGFWKDAPRVLAGRDLRRGGTWLGITRDGRWAALTNFREPSEGRFDRSRGDIVRDYLSGEHDPVRFGEHLLDTAGQYDGFNLLFGDRSDALWLSNRESEMRTLGTGIYGLSNHLLETPWPKVLAGKRTLTRQLEGPIGTDALFDALTDTTVYDDGLPDTGLSPELERMLSSAFIGGERYGTRCSTLITINHSGEVYFEERSYDRDDGRPHRPDEYTVQTCTFPLE